MKILKSLLRLASYYQSQFNKEPFTNFYRKLYNRWKYYSAESYEQWIKSLEADIQNAKKSIECAKIRFDRNKLASKYPDQQEDLSWDRRVIHSNELDIEKDRESIKEYKRILKILS